MEYIKYSPQNNSFLKINDKKENILPQIIWHITDKCELSCPYCFSTKTGKETSLKKIDEYIETFLLLGVEKVDIAGGEPLLYNGLELLCKKLKDAGIYFTITTSGIYLEKNRKWLINNFSYFTRIICSIDGCNPSHHDEIRGKKGVFESVKQLITDLKSKKCDNIRINTVITKQFIDTILCEKLVNTVSDLKPLEWCLIQPHPANKKEKFKEYEITNKEFQKIIKEIKKIIKEGNINIKVNIRHNDNYCGYWVLYPSGYLKKHTNTSNDVSEIELSKNKVSDIRCSVKNFKYWVPLEG